MSTVAFIPARGGSKGLLKKNIKKIAGKPLIAWSIGHALASKRVSEVVVSTDCHETAAIAKSYGAKVPFLRPSEISSDTASTESAMLHYCDWLDESGGGFDNILLIQATSPVRFSGRFDQALKTFSEGGYDSLVSVVPSHRFFWKNPTSPQATYDYVNRSRRQDIDESHQAYMETGSFYITKMSVLKKMKNRLGGRICLFETSEQESYEIDSLTDFLICEMILTSMSQEDEHAAN